jgi:hypothetical protein
MRVKRVFSVMTSDVRKPKRTKADSLAHFGDCPRAFLAHYASLKAGFVVVDADIDLAQSLTLEGRYVVVPKNDSSTSRKAIKSKYGVELKAIGFLDPSDTDNSSNLYFTRKKVVDGKQRLLDLETLRELNNDTKKRKVSSLKGLFNKKQVVSHKPANDDGASEADSLGED